jgi:hypothetical protein
MANASPCVAASPFRRRPIEAPPPLDRHRSNAHVHRPRHSGVGPTSAQRRWFPPDAFGWLTPRSPPHRSTHAQKALAATDDRLDLSRYGLEMGSSAARSGRPKGLPKTGGRRKGVLNKKTLGLQAGLLAAGASPEIAAQPLRLQPLQFMLDVMNDASLPFEVRLNAARWSAPYCHHHKRQVDTNGISQPLVVQILRFSPEASEPAVVIEHDSNEAA